MADTYSQLMADSRKAIDNTNAVLEVIKALIKGDETESVTDTDGETIDSFAKQIYEKMGLVVGELDQEIIRTSLSGFGNLTKDAVSYEPLIDDVFDGVRILIKDNAVYYSATPISGVVSVINTAYSHGLYLTVDSQICYFKALSNKIARDPFSVSFLARSINDAGFESKSIEDFGAVGDGENHPLSSYFPNLVTAQTVYPHATSLSDQIDWCAWQAAINWMIGDADYASTDAKSKIKLVANNPTYMVNKRIELVASGERFFKIESSSHSTIRTTISGIGALYINSNYELNHFNDDTDAYDKRLSNVELANLEFENGVGGTGNYERLGVGLELKYFGQVHLENVNAKGFNKGYEIAHGSGLTARRFTGQFNARGLHLWSLRNVDYTGSDNVVYPNVTTELLANIDTAYFTDNTDVNVDIDGVQYVRFTGLSHFSNVAPTEAGVYIHSSQSPTDKIIFESTGFDFAANSSNVVIGSASESNSIGGIVFQNSWFSSEPVNSRIRIVANLKGLHLNNVVFDNTSASVPDIEIMSTQQVLLEELVTWNTPNPPTWKIRDRRYDNSLELTDINFKDSPVVNANADMRKFIYGWSSNKTPLVTTVNAITGAIQGESTSKRGIYFTAASTEAYIESLLEHHIGGFVPNGKFVTCMFIAKYADGYSCEDCLEILKPDGTLVTLSQWSQSTRVYPMQEFSNGLKLYVCCFVTDRSAPLAQLRLSNRRHLNQEFYIDYFSIQIDGYGEQALVSSVNVKPTEGYWLKGETISNREADVGDYAYYRCTTKGDVNSGTGVISSLGKIE